MALAFLTTSARALCWPGMWVCGGQSLKKMVWDSVSFQRLWQQQADWESPYNLSPVRELVSSSSCCGHKPYCQLAQAP